MKKILMIIVMLLFTGGCAVPAPTSTYEPYNPNNKALEEGVNYQVVKFEVIDKNNKLVNIYFESKDKKKEVQFIEVDFKLVPVDRYYCTFGIGGSNTLNGTMQIQKNGINQIRLSKDLEQKIKSALNN